MESAACSGNDRRVCKLSQRRAGGGEGSSSAVAGPTAEQVQRGRVIKGFSGNSVSRAKLDRSVCVAAQHITHASRHDAR